MDDNDGLAEFLEGTKHERTFCRSSARLLKTAVFSVTSKFRTIWADSSSVSFRFFSNAPQAERRRWWWCTEEECCGGGRGDAAGCCMFCVLLGYHDRMRDLVG